MAQNIAIIGAGIAGLSVGFWLKQLGIPSTLYEAAPRAGGKMGSVEVEGYIIERGPQLFMDSAGHLTALSQALGLSDELRALPSSISTKLILHQGKLETLQPSPRALLKTRLLSPKAKLRAALEPLIPRTAAQDESVAQFIARRFGEEVLEQLIDPLITVTQLGEPRQLSLAYTMPGLRALEQEHGSVLLGAMRSSRTTRPKAPPLHFVKGSQRLIDALTDHLGDGLRLKHQVKQIKAHDQGRRGYTLTVLDAQNRAQTQDHSALIFAAPAWALARITLESMAAAPEALTPLGLIPYAPAALVTLGYDEAEQSKLPQALGFVVPSKQRRKLLACTFSTSISAQRAPEGKIALCATLGGAKHPADMLLGDQDLINQAAQELSELLGLGEHSFAHVHRHHEALAQCGLTHTSHYQAQTQLLRAHPNMYALDHFSGQASVPALMSSAHELAMQLSQKAQR